MLVLMVLHEGQIICYGPFADGEAVTRYVHYHKLHGQHYFIVPLHDSGDTLDA